MNEALVKKLVKFLPSFKRNAIGYALVDSFPVAIGGSKFGGKPDVSTNFKWPVNASGFPLSFLLQLDCADLSLFDIDHLLPSDGHLYFFYEMSEISFDGKRDSIRVLYSDIPTSQLRKMDFPTTLALESRLKEYAVELSAFESLPSGDDLLYLNDEYLYSDFEELDTAFEILEYEEPDAVGFQGTLLGYSTPIQKSVVKDFNNEILLLQMSSFKDADFELMFGDEGYIYFTISREELASRCFNNVKFQVQCY